MKGIPYKHFPKFILRTPLFPLGFLKPLTEGSSTDEEDLAEVCRNRLVQEAIWLGSPDLHSRLQAWLSGDVTDREKVLRIQYALMRYILRMCSRSTPFGLFAGISVGTIGEKEDIQLVAQSSYKRYTRLDMQYICALTQNLTQHKTIREKLAHYPNSSLYRVGDKARYVEYRYREKIRTHHIVEIDWTPYLDSVLELAQSGATIRTLADNLVDDDITYDEAEAYIEELVAGQVLVSELEPAVTGSEPLDYLTTCLTPIPDTENIKQLMTDVRRSLKRVDDSVMGTTISAYADITDSLRPLETDFEEKFLFQVDMVKPTLSCTLPEAMLDDILKGLQVLVRLSPTTQKNTRLSDFAQAMRERYETREIPLLHALDSDAGIGYIQSNVDGTVAPLVDDLQLPESQDGAAITWTKIDSFLLSKYSQVLKEQMPKLVLTDADLTSFVANWDNLPDTFSTMVTILKNNKGSGSTYTYEISGIAGSSAGNLIGRFCHAESEVESHVRTITQKEAELKESSILAELVHLPYSRVGNVLHRPVLREYEIPYLARSAMPEHHQIHLNDLLVSVNGNHIVLRSRRLNKEVVPRLTCAHNFRASTLHVYRFLADLQTQNSRIARFMWSSVYNECDFFPRVSYKNIILSPARWRIKRNEIKRMLSLTTDKELVTAVKRWTERRSIPVYVLLNDADNQLLVNLENAFCIRTLFSATKGRNEFMLTESLFHSGESIVKSSEGIFAHEIVLSFYRDSVRSDAGASTK
jgi:hypothetical protein